MLDYPSPETWEYASSRQAARAARSFSVLRQRAVPVYWGPLMVDDDDAARVQSAEQVARRTTVLWAVALRAECMPRAEAVGIIDQLDLWATVSPVERLFLANEDPSADERRDLKWRYEAIWLLMWALGYIEQLDWPGGICDVPKLAELLAPLEDDTTFITAARLRPATEILDAQDLIMRVHWAVRDAFLHRGGMVPDDLDWSGTSDYIPVMLSAAHYVVQERHHTLNWLVNFPEPRDWDRVSTPT